MPGESGPTEVPGASPSLKNDSNLTSSKETTQESTAPPSITPTQANNQTNKKSRDLAKSKGVNAGQRKSSLKPVSTIRKMKVPTMLKGKSGSELWQEREKVFEKFRRSSIVMPVPETSDGPARVNKVSGYSIDLHLVKNWPRPEPLKDAMLTFGVQLTFFHSITRRFFGNTWTSPELKDENKSDVTIQVSVCFLSDVVDPNCVSVLELVAYEKDPTSFLTRASHGCGWCLLPTFGQKLSSSSFETLSVSLFQGSPRNLWIVNQADWQNQDKISGCKLLYHVHLYEALAKLNYFLRKNEIISCLDKVPGLKADNLVGIQNSNAVFKLPQEIATAEDFSLIVTPHQAFVHLREELEANLIDRLTKTRKLIHKDAESIQGEVSSRVLKIALHNGRCFRTRQHTVPLKCDRGSNSLTAIDNVVKLKGYTLSPLFAVIVLLQYTVHFRIVWPKSAKPKSEKEPLPTEDVVVVTIGARALIPSDGLKFYYHDRSVIRENSSDSDTLHVELLSGTKARPYSDNVIYTSPAWNNSVKEGFFEESFASCDIELLVEGASLSSSSETDEPEDKSPKPNTEALDREKWIRELYQKAQIDSALARTLQAPLNNQLPSPKKHTTQTETVPKRHLDFSNTETTIITDDLTPSHELSRASKTLLTRHGYYDGVTISTDNRSDPKSVAALSPGMELKDGMNLFDIHFQFAAFRTIANSNAPIPGSFYFTFQFYTFEPTRTERLLIIEAQAAATYLLCRDHAKRPALAIQFEVHTTKNCPLEATEFVNYLLHKTLHIDVWNGESLLPIGSIMVPLHQLLRQGLRIKKHHAEYDLRQYESNEILGSIQLLMSNFAAQSTPCPTTLQMPNNETTNQNWRLSKSTLDNNTIEDELNQLRIRGPKHRVRAKPLADSNEELRQLLIKERFYEDPSAPHSSSSRLNRAKRAQSDSTSITKDEIEILCKRFQTQTSRNNRLDANALLSLLSFQSQNQPNIKTQAYFLSNEIKQAFLEAFARGIDFRSIFDDLDSNGDGILSKAEFIQGLYRLSDTFKAIPPQLFQAFIDMLDKDGDGQVNYAEFLTFLKEKLHFTLRQELKAIFTRVAQQGVDVSAIFRQLDTSQDGQLTFREFEMALKQIGFLVKNHKEFDEFCNSLDDDKNGTISYMEFIKHMGLEGYVEDSVLITLQTILKRTIAKGIDIGELFQHIDSDGSGSVSYSEFMKVLKDLDLDSQLTAPMLQEIVLRIDKDKNGSIDIQEFLSFTRVPYDAANMVKKRLSRILMKAAEQGVSVHDAFKQFDHDNSGQISSKEFEAALKSFHCPVSPKELELVLKQCDANNDGSVSYKEFLEFCLGAEAQSMLALSVQTQLATLLNEASKKGLDVGQCFQHFDKDGSGEISTSEFIQGLNDLGFKDATNETYTALINRLDKNKDGKINYQEFIELATPRTRSNQDIPTVRLLKILKKAIDVGVDVEAAFQHFDKTNSGSVSYSDFEKALCELEVTKWTKEDMEIIFKHLDKDGGGSVSLKEFQIFLQISLETRFRLLLLKAQKQGVDIRQSFNHFTTSESIDIATFRNGLEMLQFNDLTPNEVKALFTVINTSNTDSISITEFAAFIGVKIHERNPLGELQALLEKAKSKGVDINASFSHFDKDQNGMISYSEFDQAMKELNFDQLSVDDLAAIRAALDKDNSGSISLKEFTSLYATSSSNSADPKSSNASGKSSAADGAVDKLRDLLSKAKNEGIAIDDAFREFDADGDGVITYAEFNSTLSKLGFQDLTADDVETICKSLDTNNCGSISLHDFKSLYSPSAPAKAKPALTKKPSRTPVTRGSSAAKPWLAKKGSKSSGQTADEKQPPVDTTTEPTAKDFVNSEVMTALVVDRKDLQVQDIKSHPQRGRKKSLSLANPPSEIWNTVKKLLNLAIERGVDVVSSFEHFDKNKDGSISYEEFGSALKELGLTDFSEKEVIMVCNTLDADGSGGISLHEFKGLLGQKRRDGNEIKQNESNSSDGLDQSQSRQPKKVEFEHQRGENNAKTPKVVGSKSQQEDFNEETSYRLSSDPEIRSLETKLRKAAIASLARGVPAGPLLTRYTQKQCGEVLRVDFVQFLMELGLSVIDDIDTAGYVCNAPIMHDKVYARQLERLRQYRQRNRNTNQAQKELIQAAAMSNRTIPTHNQAHVDSFIAHKNKMLQVIQYYRDGQKKAMIHALLRDHVTTTIKVYPRFGTMIFLEFPVRNPYGHTERFRIEWNDPELFLVRCSKEWQYYRDHVTPAVDIGDGQVEIDMIDDMHEILLDGGDSVSIPFRLITMQLHKHARTIPVYVKSVAHGQVISVLQLHVQPLSFVCHRTYRFYSPSGGILRRCLRFVGDNYCMDHPNQEKSIQKFVACPDSSVVVETKPIEHKHMPLEIFMKYRVGDYPSCGEFYLLLYHDMYHAKLYEIWRICVQSMLRLDLHATMGQGVHNELIIKGDSFPRRVRCYTSHPNQLHFNPERIFQLLPHAFNRIEVQFCSMVVTTMQILVHLVDVDNHELVSSWLLNTTTIDPIVTKIFDLNLPLGIPSLKKISYRNPWDDKRIFILRSSDTTIMRPREDKIEFESNGNGFLRLSFAPYSIPCSKKVYLFLNDNLNQNEECILLHVTWIEQ